jgi:hypothetical protein
MKGPSDVILFLGQDQKVVNPGSTNLQKARGEGTLVYGDKNIFRHF